MTITPVDPRPLDILDGEFYVDDPYSRYAWLRENSPCHWDDINELWVITRYDDIVATEKNKRLFINSGRDKGGYRPNIPADTSIIANDDPLHQARRSLVSRRFTPRAVQQWRGHITEAVDLLIDPVVEQGRAEIVGELAAPLPGEDDRFPARLRRRPVAQAQALVRGHHCAGRRSPLPQSGGCRGRVGVRGRVRRALRDEAGLPGHRCDVTLDPSRGGRRRAGGGVGVRARRDHLGLPAGAPTAAPRPPAP